MLGLPGQGVCPLPGTLGYLPGSSSGMGEAWVPLAPVVPGHRQTATWWTARSWGELLRKRTRQRRSPWLTLNRRVDIRQEILSMEADDKALKVRERQEVKVKVQRSLQEAEAQSFQLYHPQVDQAKKEELHKGRFWQPRTSSSTAHCR